MRVSAARTVSALVLLIALSACDAHDGPSLAEPTPVTSTPALTPTPPRPPSPFADLPLDRAPSVGYVDHYVHIAPDGTRTRLPRGRGISSITPFLDGFLVADTRYFEATNGLALVRDGERQDLEPCASGGGVTSVAGGALAWATFGCPESSILSGPSASTGTVRYELDVPDRVYLYGFAWEDEHHLLAVAWSRRETMILRFDARGNAELAAPAVRLNGSQPAYELDSQP